MSKDRHNAIRPTSQVFTPEEDVLFEVALESSVSAFTWAVLHEGADEATAVAVGWKPRSGGRKPAAEHTISLGSAVEWDERYVHEHEDDDVHLDEGEYRLVLYAGRPGSGETGSAFIEHAEELDQDAFAVSTHPAAGSDTGHDGDIGQPLRVALVREGPTGQVERSSPVTYAEFRRFLEADWGPGEAYDDANAWPAFGGRPYQALRRAARDFVSRSKVTSFGDLVPPGYEEHKLEETAAQFPGILLPRDAGTAYLPGVELIWNYWLEEGMLVQTLNVILARFQNRRIPGRDPLARFDVTPLLPLRNRLWGYAEDELHRLTVRRRAVEYEYEYGFSLIGRAVPRPHVVVERRNGFLATFHQVLFLAHRYFKELDDLTVQADAFPLYRALRDCHIVLSQGTQNQYGEMAVAARAEFLVMQSILAEPQMREFLGGRPMTPYPEAWMDRVDSMKSIQGWTDTSIMHFNDLATIGEQLVLTIRLGNWADPGVGGIEAATWAQAFRYGIQKYAAAYRSATGVDLAQEPSTEMPSTLLARRLSGARIRA
ncbi:hypothetical protein HN031_20715 [Nocardioides sp. zg-1308]|uniref:hypothetical protein n=1 Tax=Nocardioides sp. zg-1308 TaxID=2736253 RepID=UPI0015529E0B|nr:hypothetical protein [Nocardioides sp. zg-1308]NPD07106.1 hypothetical protein [Nocardioides sp. zg-1308]